MKTLNQNLILWKDQHNWQILRYTGQENVKKAQVIKIRKEKESFIINFTEIKKIISEHYG